MVLRRKRLGVRLMVVAAAVLLPIAVETGTASAAEPRSGVATDIRSVAQIVAEAAVRFGIPQAWIYAVMHAESAGDARAISRAGAMGLMQIMPATWSYLRARYGLGADPFDLHDNIVGGAAWLRELHDRYGSPGFLAAYNAGPARYDDHLATGRSLPAETRAYIAELGPRIGVAGALDPLAWTRAALFPGRADRPVETTPSAGIPAGAPTAPGLFIPLSGPAPSP